MTPYEAIDQVAATVDEVILFHSATGKDSIALLDMLHARFKRVVCVFMYVIPGLEHVERYIAYASHRYGVQFIQVPHYALPSMIRTGFMGIRQDAKCKTLTLSKITDSVRLQTGITWAVYGFKKSDSLNRRLMLGTYDGECINRESKKLYPLSTWKNGDVRAYIRNNRLIEPINYGGSAQSSGTDITDINFLLWCRRYWPQDYKKIIDQFPLAELKVFEHEHKEVH